MTRYPDPSERIGFGEVGRHGDGEDLVILTFANGFYLSCQAQKRLEAEGINARVVDIRWLSPLPEDAILDAISGCRNVLVVDETRRTGGLGEALMTLLTERTDLPHTRLSAEDSFIATGPAYAATMPSTDGIVEAARKLSGAAS